MLLDDLLSKARLKVSDGLKQDNSANITVAVQKSPISGTSDFYLKGNIMKVPKDLDLAQ